MARHVWTVLCSFASVDKDSNNVSLMNVTEMLTFHVPSDFNQEEALEEGIAGPDNLVLMTLWTRDEHDKPESAFSRYVYEEPGGKRHAIAEREIDLEKYARHRYRLTVQRMPFHKVGIHWWLIQIALKGKRRRWRTVAKVPLEIQIEKADES